MNLSRKWLSDFVDVRDISNKDYCDRMTATGSKVEGVTVLGDDIENVVVGRILKISKHENSDHLQICSVDAGEVVPVQIVTGAQNIFEGALIPVAKANSRLPGGVVIKPGKLRGVESNGMLCSIGELGLTLHDMPKAIEDGICILDESFQSMIGRDIREALMLSDDVVEFEITPNRPDCLSVIGLARETAASFGRPLHVPAPKVQEAGGSVNDYLKVKIERARTLPALYGSRRAECENCAFAALAAHAPARCGRSSDQQYRGHHQLCYARIRTAHARVRLCLHRRQRHHSASCRRGRSVSFAGRKRPYVGRGDARHCG